MLNSRVVPQDLAWDMRHEANRPNRCTASGRRGARCRDLCCCCCYGSTASGSVDIWLLFADTVVINRVKQDNAQVVEGKGSRRSGKPRPRLTLWARLKHFSSSYTVFFLWSYALNEFRLHVLKVLQPPIMIYTQFLDFVEWRQNLQHPSKSLPTDTMITCAPFRAF